jgi:hypothetical protein
MAVTKISTPKDPLVIFRLLAFSLSGLDLRPTSKALYETTTDQFRLMSLSDSFPDETAICMARFPLRIIELEQYVIGVHP